MARRTTADALATRDNILDCAELLFVSQGVSSTTLAHIADAAGVSRGAIYWHFTDKAAVFNSMMQRVRMPLELAMQMFDHAQHADPLECLQEFATVVFRLTETDPKARRVFEIATSKIEYVDQMSMVRERRAEMADRWMIAAEGQVRLAIQCGRTLPTVCPRAVALGLWAIMDGLLRAWMIAPHSFSLVAIGEQIVRTHLAALRVEFPLPRPVRIR
jgi:TetR/AcrR family acrAB operon transcriptional repressor